MPMYEYQCAKCEKVHEVLQKISDKPLKKCPVCGGKVEKLMSQTSFQLKGTGWYTTDYAKKTKPPEKKAEAASSKPSEKKEK